MGIDFKLIPVYDTNAIFKNWNCYAEGMEKVLAHTVSGDSNLITVRAELLSGKLLLWEGLLDNVYCGFATTKTEQVAAPEVTGVNRFLSIIHLYIKSDLSKFSKASSNEIFINGMKILNEFAKNMKCDQLRMWTPREEYGQKIEPLGWKKTYVEYVLEVK